MTVGVFGRTGSVIDINGYKMRKELQDKLFNDFPDLFSKLISAQDQIWCPDGWFKIIYDLSKQVDSIIKIGDFSFPCDEDRYGDYKDWYCVIQLKEKFGGLRYYLTHSHPELDEIISQVENMSYNICGSCGEHKGPRKPNERLGSILCPNCQMIKDIIE
jgi:hypothetical protein